MPSRPWMPAAWTQGSAAAALRAWADEHGEAPRLNAWQPAPDGCPSKDVLVALFGSWASATAAAGLGARSRGEYVRRVRPPRPPRPCGRLGCCESVRSTRRSARFCSRSCAAQVRADAIRGSGVSRYYVSRGGRPEHRKMAEEHLGRSLRRGEVVHHIDGTRNNRLANLVVMTAGDHLRLHWHGGRVVALDGTMYDCVVISEQDDPRRRALVVSLAERVYAPE